CSHFVPPSTFEASRQGTGPLKHTNTSQTFTDFSNCSLQIKFDIPSTVRAMAKFNIKVFSDNVCPWCFVGKRNLESAMKQFTEKQQPQSPPAFDVRWKPFFLNVESPETSDVRIVEYLNMKYGNRAGTRMAASLEQAGQATGISFNNERKVHNTIRSHRLVRLADGQNKGSEMIEQLFHGYFEEGKNICDSDVLLELAQKAGVECTKEYLQGGEGEKEVMSEFQSGVRKHGISGVPYFVVSREGSEASVPLSGGQPPEAFLEVFDRLSTSP
ncbi:unnamed protein product, partial [Scytosiphon promiscuus]